ncbi:MAG: protein kinase [Pseudonocardiaceae bacterium]|nr:protein kinase [Pseudonocardiaceae bacterium]
MNAGNRLIAGRYRLEDQIGAGAMGVVWRARDERLDRVVAVKQLLLAPGLAEQEAEQSRARAMREGRIAARLQHPHAISVFDVALDGGDPWLVMEYLPSDSLASVLAERGPLPPREVARIGRQAADALAAAHGAGIVHRDVKPGNVLLGTDGTVKITDFGISRASGDVTVTRTGVLAGTPAYFAPEVARGVSPGPASDVFSLGSTLYAAVEGLPPFGTDENTLALLRAVADGQVRPPQRAGPLSALLMRLLQDEPANRPAMPAARDLLGDIASGADGPSTRAVGAMPSGTPAAPTPTRAATAASSRRDRDASGATPWRQRRAVLLGAGAVLLLLLGGIAFALVGSDDDGQPGVAAAPSTQRETTPQPTPTSPPPTTTIPETTVAPPPPPPPPGPQQYERTVREYYGLLPDETDAAWEYLGEGVRQQAGGRSGYEQFWSDIDGIRIDGPVQVDGDVVLLNLRFDLGGGDTSFERYRLTMAPAPDGRPLIETSESIGSYDPRGGSDRGRGDRGGDRGGGDDKGNKDKDDEDDD